MLTPLMQRICNLLEQRVRPQIVERITLKYSERNGGVPPTDARLKELTDGAFVALRNAIEQAYDLRQSSGDTQNAWRTAVAEFIMRELDVEFPQLVTL